MTFKTIVLCLCLGLGMLGSAAEAQNVKVTRDDLIELIGELPEMNGTRAYLEKQGFEGEKLQLGLEHERKLMNDKQVAGYIADRILAVYDGNLPSGWAPQGLLGPLFNNGYTHLSTSDKAFYFQVQKSLLQAMTTRDCGLVIKGRMSPRRLEQTVGKAEARMSTSTLKRYYELQRRAINMGVTRAPKTLSPTDSARIQEKINKDLRARIEGDPALKPAGIAFANMNRATPAQACQAGVLFYDVALDRKGRDLQHALLYLNQE